MALVFKDLLLVYKITSLMATENICQNWYRICSAGRYSRNDSDLSKLKYVFLSVVVWICQNWNMNISLKCYMDLSKMIQQFLFVVTCQSCYMDFLKLIHGFVKYFLCIFCPLPIKTKLDVDQDFKACWSFCFEVKLLNESKYSMP